MKRLLLLALAACATTNLPPAGTAGYRLEDDERMLLRIASEQQAVIDKSGALYADPALEAYLAQVADKLVQQHVSAQLAPRVRVLRDFRLNAFTLPNGAIYVHCGILARTENEAELATLLGHEITHATHRHSVRELRNASNKSGVLAAVSAPLAGIPLVLGGPGLVASIRGYSREMETEADENGLALVAAAGYDLSQSTHVFQHLQESVRDEKVKEPFFYATHPRLAERIENIERLLATTYAGRGGGVRNEEQFAKATAQLVLEDARLQLAAGRFAAAEREARKHLAAAPGSAAGEALLGEIERQRGGAEAAAHYRKAIQLDPGSVEAHRGLGLVLFKSGDRAGARAELSRYLELRPDAPDRAYVRQYLAQTGE
jgi:predicted Zn-dependent protease